MKHLDSLKKILGKKLLPNPTYEGTIEFPVREDFPVLENIFSLLGPKPILLNFAKEYGEGCWDVGATQLKKWMESKTGLYKSYQRSFKPSQRNATLMRMFNPMMGTSSIAELFDESVRGCLGDEEARIAVAKAIDPLWIPYYESGTDAERILKALAGILHPQATAYLLCKLARNVIGSLDPNGKPMLALQLAEEWSLSGGEFQWNDEFKIEYDREGKRRMAAAFPAYWISRQPTEEDKRKRGYWSLRNWSDLAGAMYEYYQEAHANGYTPQSRQDVLEIMRATFPVPSLMP